METTFEEYLHAKKIDAKAFKRSNSTQYDELKNIFDQVHPNSFTAQKLFLINDIRRNNPLKEETITSEKPKSQAKPKIKIRPKK
ncbi:MAG: hypothetical protein NXI20_08650 [bacterium]|nr:hypothetical protein [bacterium]